jgi:cyclic peptide transporter
MKIFKLFLGQSRKIILLIGILSLLNTAVFSGILFIINYTVAGKSLPFGRLTWLVYACLIIGSLLIGGVFYRYMIRLSQDVLFTIEVTLLEKIRHAVYQDFEKLGEERVYAAINDAKMLAQAPEVLLGLFNAAIMLLCGLGYMFWINPAGGLLFCAVMAFLLVLYMVRNASIERGLNKVRDLQDHYYRYLRDLLFGFREIRMSTRRNETIFHQYLYDNRKKGRDLSIKTNVQYIDNELIGSVGWYVLLGLILFALPGAFHLREAQMTTFVIVTLYLMGPVSTLIKFIPYFTRTKIAVERIEELERNIRVNIVVNRQLDEFSPGGRYFRRLLFSDVVFEYPGKDNRGKFTVGPLNLQINRGEILFVTGSNGSGKSTFINLVAGLYLPVSGDIYWNEIRTGLHNHAYYSDQFSAIFTGNYLFGENYDQYELDSSNERLMPLIELMQLSEVINLRDSHGTIGVNYSKGQQKRIAMIYAMMENREVLLLDEWAAEQDPQFRSYFYYVLLPLLKKEGKTVIAVTHDSSYFGCADRVIRFQGGAIVDDATDGMYGQFTSQYEHPH